MADVIAQYVPNKEALDLITWVDPKKSGLVFGGITLGYYFLACSSYTLLTLLSNILLAAVVITGGWANIATIIGRAPPPIPKIEITETQARAMADKGVAVFNKAYGFVHTVLLGSDIKLSFKVSIFLFLASKIFAALSLFTMIYSVAFFAFVLPKVYILKQKEIDNVVALGMTHVKTYYKTIEDAVSSKMSKPKAT